MNEFFLIVSRSRSLATHWNGIPVESGDVLGDEHSLSSPALDARGQGSLYSADDDIRDVCIVDVGGIEYG